MGRLEFVERKSNDIEQSLQHGRVLFIGSESYDAPTITVVLGLNELGVDVHTIQKSNINSWFCNQVITDPEYYEYDFVLSNLHWGTRWSYYNRFDLGSYPWILIDGDDNKDREGWCDKFERYQRTYHRDPPTEVKDQILQPDRWVEPLSGYEPDVVFTSQNLNDDDSYYLPFGIHEGYMGAQHIPDFEDRRLDFLHVPGAGSARAALDRVLRPAESLRLLPPSFENNTFWGARSIPKPIADIAPLDDNVHSYHRWVQRRDYLEKLKTTRALIYPAVDLNQWDSKRPWEAYASGAAVLMQEQKIEGSAYPPAEICADLVWSSIPELWRKLWKLHLDRGRFKRLWTTAVNRAHRFFTPEPIARYFLWRVLGDV